MSSKPGGTCRSCCCECCFANKNKNKNRGHDAMSPGYSEDSLSYDNPAVFLSSNSTATTIKRQLSVPARLFLAGKQDAISSTPSPTSKLRKRISTYPQAQALYVPKDADRPEGLKDFIWIFLIATVVKILLIPSYRSTDFEVHRNWLAITHSLPMHKWYFDATSEWTLDYPPLFAYFEWSLSQVAQFFDKDMLVVNNLGHATQATIVFQRLSVIVGDLTLLFGILMWSKTWSSTRLTECAHSRGKVAVIGGLTFFNPGLLMVDHVHFQYNGMLMGLLLISVALIRMRNNLMALCVFCVLLLMKHIFFYVVPVFGVYLLGHYCWSVVAAGQLSAGLQRCRSKKKSKRKSKSKSSGKRGTSSSDKDGYSHDDEEDDDDDYNDDEDNGNRIGNGNGNGYGGESDADSDNSEYDSMFENEDDRVEARTKRAARRRLRRHRTLSEDILMHVQTGHFKPFHFLALVCIALVALLFTFGPIIASDVHHAWSEHGHLNTTTIVTSSTTQLAQIFSRMFPWGRGLCHAYWAPNVWSWYVTADRVARRTVKVLKIPLFQNMTNSAGMTGGLVQITAMSVLPNIQPIVTFALTFLFIVPVLWKIWKFPHPLAFAHALVYCQMCSFMLGYHVHEKAILMAIVPVGMLAADSVDDAKVYLLMSWIGHFSLFPLLEERRELLSKILITSIHMLLSYVSLDRYHRSEQRAIHIDKSKRGIRFTTTEHLYLCGIGVLFVFVEFIHPVMFVKINKMGESTVVMPFLPLMLMSIYCAIGLMYTWHLSYKQYIAKIKRIMSYAESPYLAPDVPTVNEIPPHFDLNQ